MSELVGVRVKCPECGATLRANADLVTCPYCGTESRVQRRTQVFQRPIELPPVGLRQPHAIALQQASKRRLLVFVAIVVIALMVPVVVAVTVQGGPSQRAASPPPVADVASWSTRHPLLVDLDNDGLEDAVGLVRYLGHRDEVHVRAVSGQTGKTLWEGPSLGTFAVAARGELALASGVVLYGDLDHTPRLEAFDAVTGAKKWSIKPGEVVKDLCNDRDGHVKLVTKDEVETSIDLSTGSATPQPKRSSCTPLPTTEVVRVTHDVTHRHWGFAPPGMQTDAIAGDASSWILSGYKSPGTAIPMIAVIDDHEHVKWTSQLASTEPMTSKALIDQVVAYDATLVATVYGRSDEKQPPVLVGFDRERGTRVFETTLQRKGTWYLTGIALQVGPTTVWVELDDGLRAYDRKTGTLRWAITS